MTVRGAAPNARQIVSMLSSIGDLACIAGGRLGNGGRVDANRPTAVESAAFEGIAIAELALGRAHNLARSAGGVKVGPAHADRRSVCDI